MSVRAKLCRMFLDVETGMLKRCRTEREKNLVRVTIGHIVRDMNKDKVFDLPLHASTEVHDALSGERRAARKAAAE